MKALVVVDVQCDFIQPHGNLPIENSYHVVYWVNDHRREYDVVIFTKDFHPPNHCSFKENGGIWPAHCVFDSWGSNLLHTLHEGNIVVYKGSDSNFDSYSGFKDDGGKTTLLAQTLREKNFDEIDVVGVATEYCVKFTVLDGLAEGFKVNVIKAGCAGLEETGCELAFKEMEEAGAAIK